jgi:hypothetical protein
MGLDYATLTEVVSLGCIAETLSVAALGAILDVTIAPDVRDVVRSILKDETSHAKLGWAHLAAERNAGRGDFLSERLPRMMEASIPVDLFASSTDVENDEALAFGQLPRSRRVSLFRETFDQVIFPGFDTLGIGTTAAREWLASRDASVRQS